MSDKTLVSPPDTLATPAEIGAAAVDKAFEDIQSLPPEATAENVGSKNGDNAVEFHKPKPVHSWREFLKEYAIIVLGVITALAAEQTVEWLHWESEVKTARQSLIAEMTANNENMLAYRIAIEPCLTRQINEVDAVITALEAGQKASIARFQPATASAMRDSEWQSERASQVLTHFPSGELAQLNLYYAQLPGFGVWQQAEVTAWAELSILKAPPAGITTSDLIRLRVNLAIARRMDFYTLTNARRIMDLSKRLGAAASVDAVRAKNYCTMNEADYLRYRSGQDLH